MERYDAIVLGAGGGVGSAALWHLAQRGVQVLGLDRFEPPHDRGSSHGQTRIIRQAYFEHPDYTPLLLESYRLWEELETLVGRQLYHEVGLLQVGPADGVVVPGVLRAAREHCLEIEQLDAAEIHQRWPGLAVPTELVGVFERRAGYLLVEQCVMAHLEAAQRAGAELRCPVEVRSWSPGELIRVETSAGAFATERLIVAAGAWAGPLLADLGVPLEVRRKSLFWYAVQGQHYEAAQGFPGFLFELPDGVFYGFPQIDNRGIKVGEHTGGLPVADPLLLDRSLHREEQRQVETFLGRHFPAASAKNTDHAVCMYTMSPDEHFVVDRHPSCPGISFAAGLSGHGFKFTSVLGQALADLSLEGKTDLPAEFLSLGRLQG
ncbi:MAG: N-methyl-L-tryptophan oxidase [Planctomycetales bacterium]|nr:N-methyl-L-tryptophan oxidase [Planctomycetales bacterium]